MVIHITELHNTDSYNNDYMSNHEQITDWRGWQDIMPKNKADQLPPVAPGITRKVDVVPGQGVAIVTEYPTDTPSFGGDSDGPKSSNR